jgi:hypothetical protein
MEVSFSSGFKRAFKKRIKGRVQKGCGYAIINERIYSND